METHRVYSAHDALADATDAAAHTTEASALASMPTWSPALIGLLLGPYLSNSEKQRLAVAKASRQ